MGASTIHVASAPAATKRRLPQEFTTVWILIFLFGLSCLVIGWTCFGYYLWLGVKALLAPRARGGTGDEPLPFLSVVVPCYNEADQIAEKVRDIAAQDYPRDRMELVFVDGGSTDDTVEQLEALCADDTDARVVRCPEKGKVNQLNYVLPSLRGTIVVNTDVDARLEPNVLSVLAREFQEGVGVVGACVLPTETVAVDRYYWDAQNRGRLLESDSWTSSIVVAGCYAFRRALIDGFPEDVVADDIHVAFEANAQGLQTVYSRKAVARELRGPANQREFFAHKFRKSNAFLREGLRFLYRLPEMPLSWKLMYATKVAQLFLLPWAGLVFLLVGGALLTLGRYDVAGMGLAVLFVLLVSTSAMFRNVRLPRKACERSSVLLMVKCYVYSNLLLLLTALSYPFCRQSSQYTRFIGRGGLLEEDQAGEQAETGAGAG
jgi:cellulose synthase/poly-beta-1,6-N-acetylglucosamine synthase-like glycosyltransferase